MFTPAQETYYELTHRQVDELINNTFPNVDYSCVSVGDWDNDSLHAYTITTDDYQQGNRDEIALFLEDTDYQPGLHSLLCALAEREVIPWGNYLIEAWW